MFDHSAAMAILGGRIGHTPFYMPLAWMVVIAAGFCAVGKYGSSSVSYMPQHDIPMAAPAE